MHIRSKLIGVAAAAALVSLAGATTPASAASSAATSASAEVTRGPLAPSVPSPAARHAAADTPDCYFGDCYDYVDGYQYVTTSGMSVMTTVEDPKLNHNFPTDEHSLQEISVQNTNQTDTVELGWTVDHDLNGDYLPHLFVFHWVNGSQTCYNACGFVRVPSLFAPGDVLLPGIPLKLSIKQTGSAWWLSVDGMAIGYFPNSLWNGAYTQGQLVSAFGEVALDTTDVPSCTQMGDGQFGTSARSSQFAGYSLYSGSAAANLTVFSTSAGSYDQGSATATGFHLGGPGSNAACTS